MFKKSIRFQRGLSLIELMVSIVIFATVLMAFAMVFPSGYRLNRKTRAENRAAQLANGVMNKLLTVEFNRNDAIITDTSVPSLANLDNGINDYDPRVPGYQQFNSFFDVDNDGFFLDGNGQRTEFFLPNPTATYPGISQPLRGVEIGYINQPITSMSGSDETFAGLRVTVAWIETSRGGSVYTRFVTITAYRTDNK